MAQENEIIALLLNVVVLAFLLQYRAQLRSLPGRKLFYASFGVLLAARILTILEGFLLGDMMNLLEHLGYAISGGLIGAWSIRVFGFRGKRA